MKKSKVVAIAMSFVLIIFSGCSSNQSVNDPSAPTSAETNALPTITEEPTLMPTEEPTVIPTPTPLPGDLVLPIDSFSSEIPWLPMDNTKRPGTYMFMFNTTIPPFTNESVRKAFVAAIDRESLIPIAEKYGTENPVAATSLVPSETLGRDFYNVVGIPFDPDMAKQYLAEAGYTDPENFPSPTVLINVSGDAAPGYHVQIANAMIKMWQENLGITVNAELLDWETYKERIVSNPPEILRLSWAADFNDPDNFLRELFVSDSQYNYGHFSNTEYDQLVEQAANTSDPAERQILYTQAEQILCEKDAAILPIYHATWNLP
jgi:ABC-type oligopeptide transport system substrate-binding subunit